MTETNSDIRFVEVTEEGLIEFLKRARKRILVAKPGYSKAEIEALVSLAQHQQVHCDVYIDPDEAAVRYGFGDADALKLAKDSADILDLQAIQGIRLSIVIVDEKALVYTPAALSWEEEPHQLAYPNGLEGGNRLVEQLLTQFGATRLEQTLFEDVSGVPSLTNHANNVNRSPGQASGAEGEPFLPDNVRCLPTVTIHEVRKAVVEESLKQTIESLEKNPPVDPSALRQVNIYRNLYKLVKFQIRGVQVKNKTLDLALFNRLLPQSNRHLRRSWQIFTADDVEKIAQFPQFRKRILAVLTENTVEMGRHGYLISLDKKKTLEAAAKQNKDDFLVALKTPEGPGAALQDILQESKTGLVDYLFQEIKATNKPPERLFASNRIQLKRFNDEKSPMAEKDGILREVLENFIDDNLHFPDFSELVKSIDITLDYYDVSDELLKDEEFKERLKEANVNPRQYAQGYEQENHGQATN